MGHLHPLSQSVLVALLSKCHDQSHALGKLPLRPSPSSVTGGAAGPTSVAGEMGQMLHTRAKPGAGRASRGVDPRGCVRAAPGAQHEAAGLPAQGHPPATFVLTVLPLTWPQCVAPERLLVSTPRSWPPWAVWSEPPDC